MPAFPLPYRPALALFIAWGLAAALYGLKAMLMLAGTPLVLDADDAMRLVDLKDLLAGQGWFDLTQHRLNTPFGASMHWSRLVDAPEAALVLLLRPVAGDAAPLLMASIWPLLLLLPLLWLTLKLAATLWPAAPRWAGLVLVPLSVVTLGEFTPGRVDHHNVQILLTLAMVWLALGGPAHPARAAFAGLAGALALCVGIEGLPMVVATGLALGLAFVAVPAWGDSLRQFALGLAVGAALGLALTTAPAEWPLLRLDAISIVYVGAAGLAVLVALAVTLRPAAKWWRRLLLLALAGALAAAVLLIAVPPLRLGPYAALDPWLVQHWLSTIAESQGFRASFADDPVYPLAVTVPVLGGLAGALLLAWRQPAHRLPALLYALLLVLGAAVMILQIRAARIVTPLAIPGDMALVGLALSAAASRRGLRAAAQPVLALCLNAGLVVAVLASFLPVTPTGAPLPGRREDCLQPAAFTALAALPPARVMAPIDLGAHILLYTPHGVVGAPYHRNQQGLLDNFRFFNGPLADARQIAAARGLTLVVTCPAMREMAGLSDRAPDSLVNRLQAGELPDFLTPVNTAGPLLVYALKP